MKIDEASTMGCGASQDAKSSPTATAVGASDDHHGGGGEVEEVHAAYDPGDLDAFNAEMMVEHSKQEKAAKDEEDRRNAD